MSSIDNRVVQMEFDNRQFERGISTSMKSLGLFQNALSGLGGSAKNLNEIDEAANRIDFSPLFAAADAITRKFSFVGTFTDQLIRNLEYRFEALFGTVIRYTKMMSIDQIGAGFDKYARKTEAVQTIINATGEDIVEVNKVLDKLNKYTDETSYDFVTMTSSIGKFTSAGVDLRVAEDAMEGIANWAAKAGVGPERAASAFYNMSQAIGTGAMKLQDWKSIENLNMATKDVKEQFIQAGVAAGTLVEKTRTVNGETKTYYETQVAGHKAVEISVEDFNSSLAQGWLTKDVLIATMQKYADQTTEFGLAAYHAAQEAKTFNDAIEATKDAVSTGWLKTFEMVFGNYEEAKVLWTDMANNLWEIFAAPAEARNELLEEWHVGGGYEAFKETIDNIFAGLISIINLGRDILSEVFPAPSAERLIEITERIRDFTERFSKLADLKEEFEKFKSIMETRDLEGALKFFTEDQVAKFSKLQTILTKVRNILQGFKSALGIVGNLFSALFRSIKPLAERLLPKLGGGIFDAASSFGKWITNLENTIKTNDTFYNIIQKIIGGVQKVIGFFKDLIGITDNTTVSFGALIDRIKNTKFISSILGSIANFKAQLQSGKSISDILKDAGNGLVSYFGTAIQNIGNKIKEVWPNIINAFKNLDFSQAFDFIGTAVAGGLGIKIIQFFKNFNLKGIKDKIDFSGITGIFDGLTGALESFQNKLNSETIRNLAISVAILAGSLLLLAAVPQEDLMRGIAAVGALMGELIGFTKILSSGSLKNIGKIGAVSKSLIKLSAAVVLLSVAVTILSKLSWEELGKGLLGIVVILGALIGVSYTLNTQAGKMKKAAKAMIPLAAAVVILAYAVKMLSKIDPEGFKQGLIGIVAIIGMLSVFALATSISKFGAGTGIGLIGLAASVLILYSAVSKFAEMDSGGLKQGLIAVGLLMAITSIIMVIAGEAKHVVGSAVAFIVIGAAMNIMASAISKLGDLSISQLIKGLVGMSVAIGVAVTALLLLNKVGLKGAVALIVVSAAVSIFAAAIKLLSTIPLAKLLISLGALVVGIAALGIAAAVLSGTVPAMLGLAGALTLIGASVFLAGAGLLLFAMALASLAVSGTAAAFTFVAALGIFLDGIVNLGASLTRAIATLGAAVCDAIIILTPKIMKTISVLLSAVLVVIVNFLPRIGEILGKAIIIILQILGQWVGPIVQQLIVFLVQIVNSLADGIRASASILFPAVKNLVSAIIEFVISAFQMLVEMVPGIGKKISAGLDTAKEAVRNFLTEDSGSNSVTDLANGMEEATPEVRAASEGVATAVEDPMRALEELGTEIGTNTGINLGDGITNSLQTYEFPSVESIFGEEGGLGDIFKTLNISNDAIASGGTESANAYLDAISASTEKAGATGQELANAVIEGTKTENESFAEAGRALNTAFSDGVIEDMLSPTHSGAEIGAASIVGISSQTDPAKQAGISVSMGFSNGMYGLRKLVYDTAYKIGLQAITAVKEAIHSHSPSKESAKLGGYFGEGFAIGIDNTTNKVETSGTDLAKTALASKINSLLNADPTIAQTALGYASKTQSDMQKLVAMNELLKQNQNGTQPIVNVNVTTQELSNSTVDYLVRRVNSVLGGKI